MMREEMLQKLGTLLYTEIWPDDSWEDIGFTESRIWVNSKGYGYFMCDENNIYYEAKVMPEDKWFMIREKLGNGILTNADIEGTSLTKLYFCQDKSDAELYEVLRGLLTLPEHLSIYYCAEKDGEILFFPSAKEFWHSFERDWCDVKWEELDDTLLSTWISRLFDSDLDRSSVFENVE